MELEIIRTKRPRDAYKVCENQTGVWPSPATRIRLTAVEHGVDDRGRWFVRFRHLNGYKRSRKEKIPPFWDTDVGEALLRWNRDNGGNPEGAGAYGSRFITPHRDDAIMTRMAFA